MAADATGRPALATTADQLRSRLGHGALPPTPTTILTAATALAHPATGLLSAALITGTGPRLGWPPPWRTALRDLRAHPSADVRDAALEVIIRAAE
ncbi:hypothetical protein ACGFMO_31145 [Streptomyces niveus]|uniref:hypothetical protein n=1 Tax=Streptomyces niveus TaxID=193462 RepID=UPI0037213986